MQLAQHDQRCPGVDQEQRAGEQEERERRPGRRAGLLGQAIKERFMYMDSGVLFSLGFRVASSGGVENLTFKRDVLPYCGVCIGCKLSPSSLLPHIHVSEAL